MEKMIFLGATIPILGFVLYLGGTAIMKGFSAKNSLKENETDKSDEILDPNYKKNDVLDEIDKLNKLFKDGVLTQEEFEKAKKKILEN